MAIKDNTKKPFVEDRDKNVFIGIEMPFRRAVGTEGYFASTSDTISAVKTNIRNLLNTKKGERVMQPNLGINFDNYLFEQYTDDLRLTIEDDIVNTFNQWLPFVEIRDIRIAMLDGDEITGSNTLKISIDFNIKKDPTTLESVTVEIN